MQQQRQQTTSSSSPSSSSTPFPPSSSFTPFPPPLFPLVKSLSERRCFPPSFVPLTEASSYTYRTPPSSPPRLTLISPSSSTGTNSPASSRSNSPRFNFPEHDYLSPNLTVNNSLTRARGDSSLDDFNRKFPLPVPSSDETQAINKSKIRRRSSVVLLAETRIDPWFRVIAFIGALIGILGQTIPLTGYPYHNSLTNNFGEGNKWYENEVTKGQGSSFAYSQLTFISSLCYINLMLTISVCGHSYASNQLHAILMSIMTQYPIVTLTYFTLFTNFRLTGLGFDQYINHAINQGIIFYLQLCCPQLRNTILKLKIKFIYTNIMLFCVNYYLWIWSCHCSLGIWPYPFLKLNTLLGNIIYFVVFAGGFTIAGVSYWCIKSTTKWSQKREVLWKMGKREKEMAMFRRFELEYRSGREVE